MGTAGECNEVMKGAKSSESCGKSRRAEFVTSTSLAALIGPHWTFTRLVGVAFCTLPIRLKWDLLILHKLRDSEPQPDAEKRRVEFS